jgi:predicted amidohydrolase YtcJ
MSTQENSIAKPTWQDIEKAIKDIVKAGLYYKKAKNGKFLQGYKNQYLNLHNVEEPDEYIIEYAIKLYPNKEKYMQMKEQYKNWYKYEPQILKAIDKLNSMYYKLAKDHFSKKEDLEKDMDEFLKNEDEIDEDKFLNSED